MSVLEVVNNIKRHYEDTLKKIARSNDGKG